MNKEERQKYFIEQEEKLLVGGAAFSEWCTFVSKSVYDAFINGADLATVITGLTCIETYFRTEDMFSKRKNLYTLIEEYPFLNAAERKQLHKLRKYRNRWVHINSLDDSPILTNEEFYLTEAEEMAFLAVKLLLTVLFSHPFI